MSGRELSGRLIEMARQNRAMPWDALMGVVNAILGVYMVRGREYDAEQAVKTMERFNHCGVLAF